MLGFVIEMEQTATQLSAKPFETWEGRLFH